MERRRLRRWALRRLRAHRGVRGVDCVDGKQRSQQTTLAELRHGRARDGLAGERPHGAHRRAQPRRRRRGDGGRAPRLVGGR